MVARTKLTVDPTRWSAEAWAVVRVDKRALALRSEIRRAGWFS
jgi:hypothetical protein